MRTRNAAAAKAGATKKTPTPKKDAAAAAADAAERTPEVATKSTSKSGAKTAKVAGKQSASRAAAAASASASAPAPVTVTPDPKPEFEVEKKPASAYAKKSAGGKGKTPLAQKAAAADPPKVEEVVEEPALKVEAKESKDEMKEANELKHEVEVTDVKDTGGDNSVNNEEDPADAGQQMEEVEPEEFEEPVEEEEFMGTEENVGGVEGEEAGVGMEEEEGPRVEEDEQILISDMAKRRKMKKEQEIFVGGLDRDAMEEDLKMTFEKVGEVVEVRLHKDFVTNKNKGFAFVKFANKEQAARALIELKNPMIKQKLKDYDVEGVEHITLVLDTQNEGLSRGFAFLEFSCHQDAMLAYKRLQKPDVIFGHPERTAKVAFAEPLREPDPEVMAQVLLQMHPSAPQSFQMKVRARLANPLPKTQAVKGGMSGGYRIGYTGVGVYSRFGRGFGRGRFPSFRAGFQGGRGFNFRGRGRSGRFSYAADSGLEGSSTEFQFRRPFGGRGRLYIYSFGMSGLYSRDYYGSDVSTKSREFILVQSVQQITCFSLCSMVVALIHRTEVHTLAVAIITRWEKKEQERGGIGIGGGIAKWWQQQR
ncbi:hypothetical protein B296_00030891 [Ensete ventricosum]|uniref:RRM domain-containing protein n=1 Tax=Ensete ventricosum TaxID=4639 RepID=A0A427ABA6_ENSVE|nr:hypothetical protein B296_00030891 [Ensete ventricosum]